MSILIIGLVMLDIIGGVVIIFPITKIVVMFSEEGLHLCFICLTNVLWFSLEKLSFIFAWVFNSVITKSEMVWTQIIFSVFRQLGFLWGRFLVRLFGYRFIKWWISIFGQCIVSLTRILAILLEALRFSIQWFPGLQILLSVILSVVCLLGTLIEA